MDSPCWVDEFRGLELPPTYVQGATEGEGVSVRHCREARAEKREVRTDERVRAREAGEVEVVV